MATVVSPPAGTAPLTLQQQLAVSARQVSVVLSSGAGCGKTHVLTERYLSHLLRDGAEVGQVVAITFTDRAARQLRGRIRQVLTKHLRQAGDGDADQWARNLRGLESAPISTIHAFCGTLLRQYAVEAGLDARFDVLEEVLAVNLEADALSSGLQKLLTAQTEAGEDLRQLVLLFGWRAVVEGVRHLLRSWEETRWQAWLDRPTAEIAAGWQEHARRRLLPRYVEYLRSGRPPIARCLALLEQHPPLEGKLLENALFLRQQFPRLADAPNLEAAVEELIEATKVGRQGSKAWPDADVYERVKKALGDFRDELRKQRLERYAASVEGLEQAVEVGKRLGRVVRDVVQAYAARKRLYGVVDFQDLVVLCRDLLRDRREVRERVQDRYRYVLLDEAQDTDPVQMELISLLCGAERTTGKLFAVGDANQSIYRWRGADVRQFQRLRLDVPHEGRLGLTMNFRSQPAILDFANALLGHRLSDFEPLRAFHPQVNPGACVEFLWSPRPGQGGVTEGRLVEADWIARRLAAMIGREALVVERGEHGRDGRGTGLRPVRAGDVVLLFRAMTNVHLYEAALRRHGLDYYLVGGRAFFAQQEIYDLLNLLRALENTQDAVSLAGTLRSPFCCLSDEALFVLGRANAHKPEAQARERPGPLARASGLYEEAPGPQLGSLWTGLLDTSLEERLPADQRAAVRRARANLQRWRGLKDRLPIARLLGAVFADSGFDAATQFEFLADRKLANLWKLLDLARTFDHSGLFGLAEFVQRLGDLVKNQPREEQASTQPENADVIRLMSIHQAKGLEFPVVLIPDLLAVGGGSAHPVAEWDDDFGCVARPPTDEDELPFPDFGWETWQAQDSLEEWHEDLRTLYVACTRARDYLILSSAVPEPFQPTNAWSLTLLERFDPHTGRCLAPGLAEEQRPRVIVCDGLPPEVEAVARGAPHQPEALARERQTLAYASGLCGIALDTPEPLRPPLWDEATPLTLEQLEDMARRRDTPQADLAEVSPWSFAAEDGSDRSAWLDPVQRLRSRSLPEPERLLRAVLAGWDYPDLEGWRGLLEAATREAKPALAAELAGVLQRFAASPLRQQLAAARTCLREVEFLYRVEESETGPPLRGLIDCLWQDEQDGWHLLAYAWSASDSVAEVWDEKLPGLVLAAAAVRRQTGHWPRGVGLWLLRQGQLLHRAGRHLPHRRVLAALADRLRTLREP